MEPKVSFPIPYSEPNNQSPPYPIQFLKLILILSFYLGFCLPSCCFLQVYPLNTSIHFCSPLNVLNAPRHVSPHPLIFLDLVVVVTSSVKAVLFHILQLPVVNDSVRVSGSHKLRGQSLVRSIGLSAIGLAIYNLPYRGNKPSFMSKTSQEMGNV